MTQKPIGIVVNPASGKDVRRLVARASVFDNREKSAIVRRALVGAINSGARQFVYLHDSHNIAGSALAELGDRCKAQAIPCLNTASALDTIHAAEVLSQLDCIATLVLGGDGTARAFVTGWRDCTLLAMSTGTNNVFPQMTEATIGGACLGLIASGVVGVEEAARRVKIIDIEIEGERGDIALIDAVITSDRFVGYRALLDASSIRSVVLTRAEPGAVGMTSVGGLVRAVSDADDHGLRLDLGNGGFEVSAPIAPGLYDTLAISGADKVAFGEPLEFEGPGMLALDGERERMLGDGQRVRMTVSRTGPTVIDVGRVMKLAACRNAYIDMRKTRTKQE